MNKGNRSRLKMVGPRLPAFDVRVAAIPPKVAETIYGTSEHRRWRDAVIERAEGRCEWVEGGYRCTRTDDTYRMYADHIVELKDGGAPFDPANGQCLCGSHHTLKTTAERKIRWTR